jgi:hypothetical protein
VRVAANEHALYAACGAAVLELDLRQARARAPAARLHAHVTHKSA